MNVFNLDGYYRNNTFSINIYFDRLWICCRFCVVQIRTTKVDRTPTTKDRYQAIPSIGDLGELDKNENGFSQTAHPLEGLPCLLSTQMSNKRIDLTYFEGITENRGAMNYEIDENGMVGNVLGIEMNQKDAAAIYNIPKLIAELKRMYEREDELLQAIDGWGMVICPRSGEWFEWDYGCQSESCVDKEDCRELVEQQ